MTQRIQTMAGAGNTASHAWANAPSFCPPQYTQAAEGYNETRYTCRYVGAVSVLIDGSLFARTWWNMAGDTVTEFSAAAKSRFATRDTRFDDDFAAWQAAQQPAPSVDRGGV